MKKIINVILVIVLLISIGFNIYFYREINRVNNAENELTEEIAKLGNELDKSKETLENKDIEITELETQISSKEEELKGITETLETLKAEKENLAKEIADKSSTIVEQGNSQTSGAPGGNANVGTENGTTSDIEKFCAEFGAEYIGSGGSVGNIGNGGYGITFD